LKTETKVIACIPV